MTNGAVTLEEGVREDLCKQMWEQTGACRGRESSVQWEQKKIVGRWGEQGPT